jgi:xylose dehydrogenase (NAD/NADP)
MSQRLRWGILGTARINRALVPPLRESPRNTLAAIASRDLGRASEAAKQWDIPQAYGSYDALISDPGIDVVYVPLPNDLHAEWTVRAARAGKHVLCEKPMAISLAGIDRIAAATHAAGVVVAEAFMYRHHAQTLKLRELIREGALGKVGLVRGAFTFTLTRPTDVRLQPAQGGGSLWDVGCYPVSFARFALDEEPHEAFGWQVAGPSGVDETFAGQLRFPSGALAQFDCGFRSPFRTEIEVVGSEGTLRVPRPFKPGASETLLLTRGETTETIPVDGQELYLGEVEDMADAILLGRPPRVSLVESRGNCAALLALLQSSREGRPVAVSGESTVR